MPRTHGPHLHPLHLHIGNFERSTDFIVEQLCARLAAPLLTLLDAGFGLNKQRHRITSSAVQESEFSRICRAE